MWTIGYYLDDRPDAKAYFPLNIVAQHFQIAKQVPLMHTNNLGMRLNLAKTHENWSSSEGEKNKRNIL